MARWATGWSEAAALRAVELGPGEWQTWAGVGEARLRQGRGREAVEPLERAVTLDPLARSARHLLAHALRASGRSTEADQMLAMARPEAIGPLPDGWAARAEQHMKTLPDVFERSDVLLASGRGGGALALLHEALRFHPENSAVLSRLAAALRATGEAESAWALLQPHLTRAGQEITLLVAAIHTAAALERRDLASPLVERAFELAPRSAEVRVAAADLALAEGEDERAVQFLKEAIDRAPADAGLWVQLGDVLRSNLSRSAEARDCYERALRIDALHLVALEHLAAVCLELGDVEGAEARLRQLESLKVRSEGLRALQEAVAKVRRGSR